MDISPGENVNDLEDTRSHLQLGPYMSLVASCRAVVLLVLIPGKSLQIKEKHGLTSSSYHALRQTLVRRLNVI